MTRILQLFVYIAAIAGLIAFAFYRDEKEHSEEDSRQASIYFPEHPNDEGRHEGAAMSRVR